MQDFRDHLKSRVSELEKSLRDLRDELNTAEKAYTDYPLKCIESQISTLNSSIVRLEKRLQEVLHNLVEVDHALENNVTRDPVRFMYLYVNYDDTVSRVTLMGTLSTLSKQNFSLPNVYEVETANGETLIFLADGELSKSERTMITALLSYRREYVEYHLDELKLYTFAGNALYEEPIEVEIE